EPVGAAFLPPDVQKNADVPAAGGKNAAPTGLLASLSPAQIALVERLCEGQRVFDEIAVEEINEAALEAFGDTLIEAGEDGFQIIEEYRECWKDL
ncbi:MAG: hypothetical protein FWC27_14075, partial [Firmicutes bacterium]|nr:hypothetical protein [Bacillota bacterium]